MKLLNMENKNKRIVEDWQEEDTLGSGGFGIVTLWKNTNTSQMIAIKQCRWSPDLRRSSKHCERWRQEVDIMHRLDHPNVVKALAVPACLDVPDGELPLLAMEYCSGGDLRKELNRPENCCGFRERHVRAIVRQVTSAMKYLHSLRIIHRDLKPENIVIQENNGKITYKLIDLGYAKELGPNSQCTSFVGTLHYLAPELFYTDKYTTTVDFWSLGLLTHEVITGQRPFLPNSSPAEWLLTVSKKAYSHITVYADDEGKPMFSEELSPCNQISDVLKRHMEEWLRVLLQWDPKIRGKIGDQTCFEMLDNILSKKVIQVFSVEHCSHKYYCPPPDKTLDHFQQWLAEKFAIMPSNQELLLSKGTPLQPTLGVDQITSSNLEEEEGTVYLFHKAPPASSLPSLQLKLPTLVERMMRNPLLTVDYERQRTSWAHAVHVGNSVLRAFYHLLHAFKLYLMQLVTKNSNLHKRTQEMLMAVSKLSAKAELFTSSYNQDIDGYEKHALAKGITSHKMISGWQHSFQIVNETKKLNDNIQALEIECSRVNAKTVELQRSPYARMKQHKALEDCYQNILLSYAELRKRPKDLRSLQLDNSEMFKHLEVLLKEKDAAIKELYTHLRKIYEVRQLLELLQPQVQDNLAEVAYCDKLLQDAQLQRQRDVWRLLHEVINKLKEKYQAMPSPSSVQSVASPSSPSVRTSSSNSSLLSRSVSSEAASLAKENSLLRNKYTTEERKIIPNVENCCQ